MLGFLIGVLMIMMLKFICLH